MNHWPKILIRPT